jgi:hypothetical protein
MGRVFLGANHYVCEMLEESEISTIARSVAMKNGTSVVDVITSPTVSSTGDAALSIRIVIAAGSTGTISGSAALDTHAQLRQRLNAKGEDRFPIIEYTTVSERS